MNYVINTLQYAYIERFNLVIIFALFSFIGWLYESTICSLIVNKRFINKGYLYGPICPIYGTGVVFNIILLRNCSSILSVFIITAILSAVIEYITSYTMELLFHARWWDYSNFPFNDNGRICLYASLFFGIVNVLIIFVFKPHIYEFLGKIDILYKQIFSILFIIVFLFDEIITMVSLNSFSEKLLHLTKQIEEHKIDLLNKMELTVSKDKAIIKLNSITEILKKNELRFVKAFPQIKIKNNNILSKIIIRIKEKTNYEN